METSVKNDPVYLISNYSRVKSSNYMIYKMLENATPENIDSYRQLIVALPEFQEGINTSSDKRNVFDDNRWKEWRKKSKFDCYTDCRTFGFFVGSKCDYSEHSQPDELTCDECRD